MSAASIQSPSDVASNSGGKSKTADKPIRSRMNRAEKRRLSDRAKWEPSFGKLLRNPDDDWIFADPFPFPETTRQAFHALARALCPPPPAPNSPAIFDQIEDDVRRALRYMHPTFAVGLIGMIHLMDVAPILLLKSLRRLRHMERGEASAFLQELAESTLGANLVFAGRMTILSMYFDQDEVQEAIGYQPRPFMAERIALRKRILAGEDVTDEDLVGPWSETAAGKNGDDQRQTDDGENQKESEEG